jgi:hypothetical protein
VIGHDGNSWARNTVGTKQANEERKVIMLAIG